MNGTNQQTNQSKKYLVSPKLHISIHFFNKRKSSIYSSINSFNVQNGARLKFKVEPEQSKNKTNTNTQIKIVNNVQDHTKPHHDHHHQCANTAVSMDTSTMNNACIHTVSYISYNSFRTYTDLYTPCLAVRKKILATKTTSRLDKPFLVLLIYFCSEKRLTWTVLLAHPV
ncbi:hypothetical protein EGW08_000849 [Elysia chlorotica]|uniref:Uncharacterized protein n=1 Tax=Elysia chlorotica TaxID=188477 RepID=A0A3S1BXN6_ELYCH|nr:hypothetical protein EGW08_000849 [Elysia chlorotica]